MADTPVSGLAAVTAFATTQEFLVNDSGTSRKITGTQLIAAVAQGTLSGSSGYAAVTANQTPITVVTDLTGATVTVTTLAGRRYKITGVAFPSNGTADTQSTLYITDGSNTQLQGCAVHHRVVGQGDTITSTLIHVPGAGSRVYKLRMAATSGTATNNASATVPTFILVEDIGV